MCSRARKLHITFSLIILFLAKLHDTHSGLTTFLLSYFQVGGTVTRYTLWPPLYFLLSYFYVGLKLQDAHSGLDYIPNISFVTGYLTGMQNLSLYKFNNSLLRIKTTQFILRNSLQQKTILFSKTFTKPASWLVVFFSFPVSAAAFPRCWGYTNDELKMVSQNNTRTIMFKAKGTIL